MRLFIAIALDPEVAARAHGILPPSLPGLRRVTADNLHLTLAFLGETPEERLADVTAAAQEAARTVEPFELRFADLGQFPERGRPRVVWVGIAAGREPITTAGSALYAALRERKLRFDDRPLKPHLTLARVDEHAPLADARAVGSVLPGLAVPELRQDVRALAVVRSVLSPKGPRYTALATAPLGSGAG